MKAKELREKDVTSLMESLEKLLDERQELHVKGKGQQTKESHRFGQVAADIARIKTVLREKQ